jgi:D-sedoheptulose 7-phosphate isomerase
MTYFSELIEEQISTLRTLDEKSITDFVSKLILSADQENNVWIAGNGGSATTAAHFATDLSKGVYTATGKKIRAICVNEFLGIETAWANDTSYDAALSNTVESFARKGDMVVLISGSGNSKNTLKAAEYAKANGLFLVTLTGMGGGKLKPYGDIQIDVDSVDMQTIENMHLVINHLVYKLISH